MSKFLYSFVGAVLFGAVCIGVAWLIGAMFGPLYEGEEESTRNFKIFLLVFLASIVAGAVSGFIYGKRK